MRRGEDRRWVNAYGLPKLQHGSDADVGKASLDLSTDAPDLTNVDTSKQLGELRFGHGREVTHATRARQSFLGAVVCQLRPGFARHVPEAPCQP